MAEVNAEGQQQALRPPSQSPPRSTMPKRDYLGPRIIEGYDPAIDAMSDRIDELEAEIERLRAENDEQHDDLVRMLQEIGQLRAAGDALAEQTGKPCRCVEAHDGAINEMCEPCVAHLDWKEARRG